MLNCYNRGCGQSYNPDDNKDDSCRHHPGVPFFHDAYKGWTCCNKKSIDFTEFLDIKGCTVSKHSNIKPPEPEKPKSKEKESDENEEIQVDSAPPAELRKPVTPSALVRPSVNSALLTITPDVLPALKSAVDALHIKTNEAVAEETNEIVVGTACKNLGCQVTYKSPETNNTNCQHHPGTPIFHEGMKYYSCCNKKTTDFTAFLNLAGCTSGSHKWTKDDDKDSALNCRYDFHQTATDVTVAIYAKMYHYSQSYVKVNPIRLNVLLVFPAQNNSKFELDLELKGIITPELTKVKYCSTKVEIILKKAEPGSWSKLALPQTPAKLTEPQDTQPDVLSSDDDLDEIETINPNAYLKAL